MKKTLSFVAGFYLFVTSQWAIAESHSVTVLYGQVNNQKFKGLASKLQQHKVLESLAELLNAAIEWPAPVVLVAQQCNQPNARFVPNKKAIVFCYELFQEIFVQIPKEKALRNLSNEQKGSVATGAVFAILLHEVGHALVNLYDLPTLGREEDVADQISTYLLLGLPNPEEALLGGVTFLSRGGKLWFYAYGTGSMANEHSLNPQRSLNIACWAFGRDPQRYSFLAKVTGLTQQRAVRCAGEYQQISKSVTQLLGSHLRLQP